MVAMSQRIMVAVSRCCQGQGRLVHFRHFREACRWGPWADPAMAVRAVVLLYCCLASNS